MYFFCVCVAGKSDTMEAKLFNPAVSTLLLKEIQHWIDEGATMSDVIERLRLRTVPPGYPIHTWETSMY